MAVKTSTFSGWRLSGKEADTFLKQVKESPSNPRAREAFANGLPMAEELLSKGRVVFKSTSSTKKQKKLRDEPLCQNQQSKS